MKVIGIDGIYFVSRDPAQLRAWYHKHLGVVGQFFGNEIANPKQLFRIEWSPVMANDKIFSPSKKQYVFSYRVDDLNGLLTLLKSNAVNSSTIERRAGGEFAHVLDPQGNKVILVQPDGKQQHSDPHPSGRVTGLGGVFFKATNAKELGAWYKTNLGLDVTEWGCSFQWIDPSNPKAEDPASTAWSPFESTTKYFAPSEKDFMFNYRVKDLASLLASLKSEGVEIAGDPQEFSYGKFGWILDPDGNKIELWEPIDGGF